MARTLLSAGKRLEGGVARTLLSARKRFLLMNSRWVAHASPVLAWVGIFAGRCAEIVEARRLAALDWRGGALLAKRYYDFNIRKYR